MWNGPGKQAHACSAYAAKGMTRSSTLGSAFPTVPLRGAPGGFTVRMGAVSVKPYPSMIGRPTPWKNSAIETDSGALPDTRYLMRPPTPS